MFTIWIKKPPFLRKTDIPETYAIFVAKEKWHILFVGSRGTVFFHPKEGIDYDYKTKDFRRN